LIEHRFPVVIESKAKRNPRRESVNDSSRQPNPTSEMLQRCVRVVFIIRQKVRAYKSAFADRWENLKRRQRAIALSPAKRANISARGKQIDAQNAAIFNGMQRAGAAALGR
jgi:hypothetical protein